MKRLTGVHRVQDHFISHHHLQHAAHTQYSYLYCSYYKYRCTYIVSVGAELPEGLDEEPGAFVARPVQSDPHGVLLQQSGQTLVHRQVFITLHVEQLHTGKKVGSVNIYSPD